MKRCRCKGVGMNRNIALSVVLASAVLNLCIIQAGAQKGSAPAPVPEYKPGQVWTYNTASGADNSRIVILRLDPAGKKGRVVHVRIDNIPLPNCGGFHLTTAIGHVAISEGALRRST